MFLILRPHVTISISGTSYGYFFLVICLVFIGECTALVGDIADHLGCFISLKDEVNAILVLSFHRTFQFCVQLEFQQLRGICCSGNHRPYCWLGHEAKSSSPVVKFRFYRRIVCRIYTRLFNFCIPGILIFKRFNFRKNVEAKN